jgi:hypothetical protein
LKAASLGVSLRGVSFGEQRSFGRGFLSGCGIVPFAIDRSPLLREKRKGLRTISSGNTETHGDFPFIVAEINKSKDEW